MQATSRNQQQRNAWKDAKTIDTQAGAILIKKACEHSTCHHFRCERNDLRIGGIDV